MSNIVVFENDGVIDVTALTSFGVSAKETENPIGMFGTGLKFAIAVLLRTGHTVTVFAGSNVLHFGTAKKIVRGVEFEFVTMQRENEHPSELAFTTDLGKNWEVWMAYRELSCNCKDENGSESTPDYCPDPEDGKTKVVVYGDQMVAAFNARHNYILQDDPAFTVDNVEVRRRQGTAFYFRGVRVSNTIYPSLFTYSTLDRMDLTEDRTLKYPHMIQNEIRRAILKSTDRAFLREVLTASETTIEGRLDLHGWGETGSDEFYEIVAECCANKSLKTNPTAIKLLEDKNRAEFQPTEITLTKRQADSVEIALDFCSNLGFEIRGAYPIKFVDSLGEHGLGLAKNETIFVASKVFDLGNAKQLASTLLEEFIHLRYGHEDYSLGMQNFLFDRMVSIGEEAMGVRL